MLTVEAAAIQKDGIVYSVPRPGRHHDAIRMMVLAGVVPSRDEGAVQGFLLSDGTFATRWKAAQVAYRAGQILSKPDQMPETLLSEDLW